MSAGRDGLYPLCRGRSILRRTSIEFQQRVKEMVRRASLFVVLAFALPYLHASEAIHASTNPAKQPPPKILRLDRPDYEDRVKAAWIAQMLACMMGWQFEHQVASTQWVDKFPKKYTVAPIDDDWYYEMVAVRGFEDYG